MLLDRSKYQRLVNHLQMTPTMRRHMNEQTVKSRITNIKVPSKHLPEERTRISETSTKMVRFANWWKAKLWIYHLQTNSTTKRHKVDYVVKGHRTYVKTTWKQTNSGTAIGPKTLPQPVGSVVRSEKLRWIKWPASDHSDYQETQMWANSKRP